MIPLEISNLTKDFADKKVLNKINLTVKDGEIFGLIGLNGVGKTTLIKIILNLLDADFGEVNIAGIPSSKTESRKNLRYLPEKFQISSTLKGIEFLKIFSDFNKCTETIELDDEILRLADLLALDRKALNLRVSKYSKGMMQKVGLISTFISESKLIILDEPMSGLDPKARTYLKNLFIESKKKGKSIFFSSHILSDIDEICDRIAILNNGEIVFTGTPSELKEKFNETSLEKAFIKKISLN